MYRLAVKRLSNSDLTFIKDYFDGPAERKVKQKALNLNSDIFVDEFYPGLNAVSSDTTIHIDLSIFGPSGAEELILARKIRKGDSYKNWRLNGEFIHTPDDDPERFSNLHEEDIAIIGFVGTDKPSHVYLDFIAAASATDAALYGKLDKFVPRIASHSRKTMVKIDPNDLKSILEEIGILDSHPIFSFILDEDLIEAAQGNTEAKLHIYRRGGRSMSKEELVEAKTNADRIGDIGEELVDTYFRSLKERGEILDYSWVSRENAIAPFDFTVTENDGKTRRLDVKSTKKGFDTLFYLSMAELYAMKEDIPYDIFRIYNLDLDGKTASLRILQDAGRYAAEILSALESLPYDIHVDNLSGLPSNFAFATGEIMVSME